MEVSLRAPSQQNLDSIRSGWVAAFWVFSACFFVALTIIVFRTPYELWDESRYANNAMEMVLSKNWMVLQYGGSVDPWITEPPGLIWVFAGLLRAGVKLPYAIRVPDILAALLTASAIYFTANRLLHRHFVAIAATLIFLSSMLYFGPHVSLNGDFEAPLCLFTTISAFSLWAFFQDVNEAGTRWIALSATMLVAAVFTKGFAGVQLFPGYFVYALVDPAARRKLVDKRLWISLLSVVGVCAAYYILRTRIDPSYWQRVLRNELLSRLGSTMEGHNAGPSYHLVLMFKFFEPGFLLGLLALFSFRPKSHPDTDPSLAQDKRSYSLALFCAVVSCVTILLFSISKTRLPYYTVNTEPLLSIFAAIGLADLLRRWQYEKKLTLPSFSPADAALFLLFIFATGSLALTAMRIQRRRRTPDMLTFVNNRRLIAEASANHEAIVVVEEEIPNVPFSPHYRPFSQLVKNEAALQGVPVAVSSPSERMQPGALLISCDGSLYGPLVREHLVAIKQTDGRCIAGPIIGNQEQY